MPYPPNDEMLHLDAAISALIGASSGLAEVTNKLQSKLPTYVEQHSSQVPTGTDFTLYLPALAQQLVRVTGFVANFPGVATFARVTIGTMIMDLPLTTNGQGVIIDGPEIALFLRPSDAPTFELKGTFTTNTSYATFWVWGEQVPTTGMLS